MKEDNKKKKYFVYIRKSSDREDSQTLSIDAQKRELKKFADRENFQIVEILEESASAYKTGRPKFNQMLSRMEKGEAEGILVYHLTRIARNSYDGGRVIYMMDEGLVKEIRTPEKAYYSTISDDKFMMHIHFAMAKKSSDDISQFVKRDIQSKILKGEYPVSAPVGYLNLDKYGRITGIRYDGEKQRILEEMAENEGNKLRRIEPDPFLKPIILEMYKIYARDICSVDELRRKAFDMGLSGVRSQDILSKSTVVRILSNPFYYGAIPWKGALYDPDTLPEENRHKPTVSKKLFDKVQKVLAGKSKPRKRIHNHKYTGIIRCGECGGMITAENQKGVNYYRCTKKKKGVKTKCSQKYIRESDLEKQIEREVGKYVMPQDFVDWSLKVLNRTNEEESDIRNKILDQQRRQLVKIEQQLAGLLKMKISANNIDGSMLSDEEYVDQKKLLAEEKKRIKEKIADVEQSIEHWLEQCEDYFDFAVNCSMKWKTGGPEKRKIIFSILFGSNATLYNKKLLVKAEKPFFPSVYFENSFDWRDILDVIREYFMNGGEFDADLLVESGGFEKECLVMVGGKC